MKRKRILVTDGASFIGSHLCEKLLEKGNDVAGKDNLFTRQKDNICHLLEVCNADDFKDGNSG